MEIAIVGAGPKALHALERLVAEFHHHDHAAPVRVDVFDPATAGPGPAYAPDLDRALLMNLRAESIDAWPRRGRGAIAEDPVHPSLTAWCARRALPAEGYLPRAVVGRYLQDAWQRVLDDAPPHLSIRQHRVRVTAVDPQPGSTEGWCLRAADEPYGPYAEVLLATGHGPPRPTDARRLPLDALAACDAIAVRGAGLTALDVVRGLAERRAVRGGGPTVLLVSRTSRPLWPKPTAPVDAAWRRALEAHRGPGPQGMGSVDALRRVLTGDAAALIGGGGARDRAEAALRDIEARAPMTQGEAHAAIRAGLRGATEGERAEPILALGAAWRWRYPQLVARFGHGGVDPDALRAFRQLGAAFEPVAFGPPHEALATLDRALHEGWVRLGRAPLRVTGGLGGGAVEMPGAALCRVDAAVDAVLPAPGARADPLVADLVARGLLSLAAGGRGVRIGRDGAAITSAPHRPGLAVIGRATEDWVIGNDTLDRTLHSVAPAWAARIACLAAAAANVSPVEMSR